MKTKAWMFLASNGKEKYIIGGEPQKVYLKKPENRANPFDYSSNPKKSWKADEVEIILSANPTRE